MQKILIKLFIFSILISTSLLSKEIQISGQVLTSDGRVGVPYATVVNKGTRTGSYTDSLGNFSFKTNSGKIILSVFSGGFEKQEVEFFAESDTSGLEFLLTLSEYEFENVVVFAESMGRRVMRRVIERRIENKEKLKSYSYELYSKFIISTDTLTAGRKTSEQDTTISSILESYSKSYFKAPDKFFNEIYKKRQSINVPPQANYTSLDNRVNAWNDKVLIFNEKIYSPFNENALDFYDFQFIGYERDSLKNRLHKIEIKPTGFARKAFTGYLLIDSIEATPYYVYLEPTKEVQLPFNASMVMEQWFSKVEGFTLPSKLKTYGSASADLFWIFSPRVDIRFENAQYNYKINPKINNDLFNRRPVELADGADELNPDFWDSNKRISLSKNEAQAYDEIRKSIQSPDSTEGTNFFTKTIAPLSNKLRFINLPPFTGWEDAFQYNRVTGLNLGVGLFGNITKTTEANLYSSFGFAAERGFGELNLKQFTSKKENMFIDFSIYDKLNRSDNPFVIKNRTITFLSFLSPNDYGDYFYNKGIKAGIGYGWGQKAYIIKTQFARPNYLRFYGAIENHRTASVNTNFTLFNWNAEFRENPPTEEGQYNLLGFELNLNYNRQKKISNAGFYLNGEFSDKSFGSWINYSRFYCEGNLRFRTLPLWKLDLRVSGAYSNGILPFQKYFSIETATAGLTAPGAMRTLAPKEYYGSRYIAANLEHNFGEIFPGLIRIPNIASFGLEFILIANAAWSSFNKDEIIRNTDIGYNFNFTELNGNLFSDQVFTEFGLGLNRLFILFRFDFMVRVSQGLGPQFRVTLSGASFD